MARDWTIRFPSDERAQAFVAALQDRLGVVGRRDASTVRIMVERIPLALADLATEFGGLIDL